MGVVPLPPPSWMTRDELIGYRDHLERQRQSLPFALWGRGRKFPSSDFIFSLWVLLPWVLSVIVKVLIGDWRVF